MSKPTKQDFLDDMNEHPNTSYRMKGENVIEVELLRSTIIGNHESSNRVLIRIWKAQKLDDGSYVEEEGNNYSWYIRASAHQDIDKYISEETKPYDHAEEVANTLANSDDHFRDFIQNNKGGVVDKKNI